MLPGDLLFFGNGKRVTHVGISLGQKEFIHQGGRVAVNSLDPASPVFSPYRSKSGLCLSGEWSNNFRRNFYREIETGSKK
ncbi:MAG: NlpC/P60 family protein [Calditrichia bacterium]